MKGITLRDDTEEQIHVEDLFAMNRDDVLGLLEQRYARVGQGYIDFVMACYDIYHKILEGDYVIGRPK